MPSVDNVRHMLQNTSVIRITQDINLGGEKIVLRDAAKIIFLKGIIKK